MPRSMRSASSRSVCKALSVACAPLCHPIESREAVDDVIDDRFLLAHRFQVDAHIHQHVGGDVGLQLHLVNDLLARLNERDLSLGLIDTFQGLIHTGSERGDVVAVVDHVPQVCLCCER